MEVDFIMNPYLEYVTEQVKYLYGWYKKGDEPNKETKRKVNKFDEVEIDIGKNNKIMRKLSQFCDKINGNKVRYGSKGDTNLYVNQVTKVCDKNGKFCGHYIARIYGGLNGPGEWERYFKDFARLFIMIKNDEYFNRAVLCQINADCADDVFTCYISFTLKKDSKQ